MLHRPSKAVMAPIAEAVGTLAGTLTQPFISRDVGYVQDDPGQKSRKVRNHMLKSPFKSVIARAATFALVLSLGIAFVTVGLAPSASAQEAEADPCTMEEGTMNVACSYDENSTDVVADFSAMDPEGEGIEWAVEGLDAAVFEIDGGVLTFKDPPDFELPKDMNRDAVTENLNDDPPVIGVTAEVPNDNDYLVTVRATELLMEGQDPPALSSVLYVTVEVNDVDEPGSIDLSRLQPQAGVALVATLNDPDRGEDRTNRRPHTDLTWEWSVPKVSRPDIKNDNHWQPAAGADPTNSPSTFMSSYTPEPDTAGGGDNDKILRVMVEYEDAEGAEKKAYKVSYHAVREAPEPGDNRDPDFDTPTLALMIPESAAVGTTVGTPNTATDADNGDILTYVLAGDDASFFNINKMNGQLTIAMKLDAERATGNRDAYEVTITAHDPSDQETADPLEVTVTATDVNEAPDVTVTGEMSKVPENHAVVTVTEDDPDTDADERATAVVLGTFDADDEDIGDGTGGTVADSSQVKLSLEGDDEDQFELSDPATPGAAQELTFKNSPNFEAPTDANQDNAYKVTVVATDKKGLMGMKALTIEVMNIDEDGDVKFSTIQPGVGQAITARVEDPDGGVTGEKWQWSRSQNEGGPFLDIEGATSASYTPARRVEDNPATLGINEEDPGDEGMFLQAKVTYRDAQSEDDIEATEDYEEGRRGVDDPRTTGGDTPTVGEADVLAPTDNAVRAVPDINDAPEFSSSTMNREVKEDESGNVDVPVKADDPDDDTLTYTIGGTDSGSFKVVPGSGQIQVGADKELDFESKDSYEVEITAMDPFGLSDSTTVTIMVLNVNEAPEFKADDPDNYAENGTDPVATFTATDPEGADVDWSVMGPDGADFEIDGGVLTFKNPPDFETPKGTNDNNNDGDTDDEGEDAGGNVYQVTVRATEVRAADAEGPTEFTIQDITVTVTNVEEPGTIDLSRLQPQNDQPLTATLTDPDGPATVGQPIGVSWQWSVPKVSRPELNNDKHWSDAATSLDNLATYTPLAASDNDGKILRVKASYADGEGVEKVAYKLSYHPVRAAVPDAENSAPDYDDTGIDFSIPENAAVGTAVGTPVAASDADAGDIITYELTDDDTDNVDDSGFFKVNKMTGQVTVASTLDHERGDTAGGNTYVVEITAYDPSNAEDTQDNARAATVTITVTDVNEAPKVIRADGSDVDGDVDAEIDEVDEEHVVVTVPADGADAAIPAIVLGTYDGMDEDANDGGLENNGDPNFDSSQVKLTLGGEDAGDFKLSEPASAGAPRELTFKDMPSYESPTDANMDNAYNVTIIATDKKGLTGTRDLTIEVENIDEEGSVKLSTIQPGVGQAITAMVTDDDTGVTGIKWQWSRAETEAGPFIDIEDATSMSYTPVGPTDDNPETLGINEEDGGDEGKFLRVTVSYRDGQSEKDNEDTDYEEGRRGIDDPRTGGTNTDDPDTSIDEQEDQIGEAAVMATSKNAVRKVPDVNNEPMFSSASMMREVEENSADNADADVGDAVTADDPDDDALTYSLSGGADMASFKIDDTSGQIQAKKGTTLDFEGGQRTYMVEVKAEDPFGLSDTTMVTITVTDKNEPPDLMLIPDGGTTPATPDNVGGRELVSVVEGTSAVGTYNTTIDNPAWSLLGVDAGDFSISGGALSFSSPPDYEAATDANNDNVYMVTVVASNGGGQVADLAVTVTVTNDTSDDETTTPGTFDPLSYDADGNGTIEKPEMISAINEYLFDRTIEKSEMIQVINLYLFRS